MVVAFVLLMSPTLPAQTTAANAAEATGCVVEGTVAYKPDPKRRWRYSRYYVNKKTGRLSEAVVALRSKKSLRRKPTGKRPVHVIDQKNFQFTPETIAIRDGDSVKFTNSDNTNHNVRVSRAPFADFNVNMNKGGGYVHQFARAGGIRRPLKIGCAFHGAMRAWIFVFDHPYYHLTGAKGDFRFTGVPPGEYDLEMRHPAGQLIWKKRVKLEENKTAKYEIVVSPDDVIGAGS